MVLSLIGTACGGDFAATSGSGTTSSSSPSSSGDHDSASADETADPGDGDGTGNPAAECMRDADCDDGLPCTQDTCRAGVCEAIMAVMSNECRPRIEVQFPPRGATLSGTDPTVVVTGTVHSPAASLHSLRINDQPVTVADDGGFRYEYSASVGGNTLVFQAIDDLDVARTRVQSFLWSSEYRLPTEPNQGIADEGLAIYLGQSSLDDGDHTPPTNDIATLLGFALQTFDIQQFIDPTTPIATNAGYNVYLTDIDYSSTDLSLAALDGGLTLQGFLYGVTGDLDFDCTILACQLAGGDGTGSLSISSIQVSSDLLIAVDANNEIVVQPGNTQTNITGLDITSDNIWTNFLITIIEPFVLGGIVSDIQNELTTQVDAQLGPLLSSAFNGLAPDSTLDFPNLADSDASIEVALVTDFHSTDFHNGLAPPTPSPPQGGAIVLRGGGYQALAVTPYTNLGVPARAGCGLGGGVQMPRVGALEIGLSDDLLNQLLYGAWQGGLLEFEMPPELLGNNDLATDLTVQVSGMLAPTASDCEADGQVRIHLGDVRIDASLVLGTTPVQFVAYSSMVAGLAFTPTGSGIEISITDVERIDTELTVAGDDAIGYEPLLTAMLENQLADGLIGAIADGGLGTIELPPIDLSATLGLPPGTAALTITTEQALRAPGVSVFQGHL